jgi:seryl-tRNA(Sec) selenium transferase
VLQTVKSQLRLKLDRLSRRELIRNGSLLTLPALYPGRLDASASSAQGTAAGEAVYRAIGVRPLINARGTFTIISGSLMLPEVREAMAAESRYHVHLDELMDAIGARLAELTKAEWGMVTCGCAAALTLATAACVAGGNPDLHVRIPNLQGFAKDEVIIPKHSRNVYDAAVRSVGVRVIEVETIGELEAALGPRTALVYILAGPQADQSPLHTKAVAEAASKRGVPVVVDAAAEILTVPNVHLQAGATLVGYSGGKCLRGPQSAGILLGRKDLVRAAWVHAAPHHGFARALKVGKEEAIGMLTAVEMWMKRDHKAEWDRWVAWLDHIARRVSAVDGVTTSVEQPQGLSNRTPSLTIRWNRAKLGISGTTVSRLLFETDPRIATPGQRGGSGEFDTGIAITPYMLSAGDEKIVADRIHSLLSNPPARESSPQQRPPAVDLTGRWDVKIEYLAGGSNHTLHLRQVGGRVEGTHQGDFVSRDLAGTIDGDAVRLTSSYTERHGDALMFTFSGKAAGDEMSGSLDMGEYLSAKWTARRHEFRRG